MWQVTLVLGGAAGRTIAGSYLVGPQREARSTAIKRTTAKYLELQLFVRDKERRGYSFPNNLRLI